MAITTGVEKPTVESEEVEPVARGPERTTNGAGNRRSSGGWVRVGEKRWPNGRTIARLTRLLHGEGQRQPKASSADLAARLPDPMKAAGEEVGWVGTWRLEGPPTAGVAMA
jgi:hypothetical protein